MTPVIQVIDTDIQTLVSNMKRDLLFEVIMKMRKTKMTLQDAQDVSKAFLAILPVDSTDELFHKFFLMTHLYKEAQTVFVAYAKVYYEEKRQQALESMRDCLSRGDIECALGAAKGKVL